MKTEYVANLHNLIDRCDDVSLLDFVYKFLVKSGVPTS